jgi:hypothetical protein
MSVGTVAAERAEERRAAGDGRTASDAGKLLTVEEFLALCERPEYADTQLELDEGRLIVMPPAGDAAWDAVYASCRWPDPEIHRKRWRRSCSLQRSWFAAESRSGHGAGPGIWHITARMCDWRKSHLDWRSGYRIW